MAAPLFLLQWPKTDSRDILGYLRFDDYEKSAENRKTDPLCKLRNVVDKLVNKYWSQNNQARDS